MTDIKVGLVGTGFMGKAHVFGFATAGRVFDLPVNFHLEMVADASDALARLPRRWRGGWPDLPRRLAL